MCNIVLKNNPPIKSMGRSCGRDLLAQTITHLSLCNAGEISPSLVPVPCRHNPWSQILWACRLPDHCTLQTYRIVIYHCLVVKEGYKVRSDVNITFEFRTTLGNGVLLGISSAKVDAIGLEIVKGKVGCDLQWHAIGKKHLGIIFTNLAGVY